MRELRFDGDRVIGVMGTRGRGREHVEQARLVIGADGRNSFVASTVRASKYREIPPIACWYYTYWPGIQDFGFGSFTRREPLKRKMLVIPTNGGLTCVLVGWPHADFARVRTPEPISWEEEAKPAEPPREEEGSALTAH